MANALMNALPTYWGHMTIHLGALSSSASLQAALEGGLEKRTKACADSIPACAWACIPFPVVLCRHAASPNRHWAVQGVLAPAGGRRMLAFIDDLHMPVPGAHACVPPLELLKLWAEHGFW